MKAKTIMIVDDHPLVLTGMAQALETEGFEIAGTATDGEAAIRLCRTRGIPELVISDIRMAGMDGFELLERLRSLCPSCKVLLFAGMPLREELERARKGGAVGYIPKSLSWKDLVASIRRAMTGRKFVDYALPPCRGGLLSAREEEVLKYLNMGKSQEEIGIVLGIGKETVKTHVRAIKEKLDASSAAGAVGRAYELGILRA